RVAGARAAGEQAAPDEKIVEAPAARSWRGRLHRPSLAKAGVEGKRAQSRKVVGGPSTAGTRPSTGAPAGGGSSAAVMAGALCTTTNCGFSAKEKPPLMSPIRAAAMRAADASRLWS